MVSDSITNASIHAAPNNNNAARDVGKKKRARSAKLKQCKLDVRREQWLSQGAVKNKDCKAEQNGVVEERKDRNNRHPFGNLGMRPGGGENDGSIHHHHHHDSDLDSNSPNSLTSSVLGSNYSETNFTGSSSSSSSSSSGGCCSGNITEDDEGGGDDGCLDDWEAVADALAANEKPKNPCLESPPEHDPIAQSGSPQETTIGSDGPSFGVENSKPQCARTIPKASGNGLAWRPDDAFRPQSLPNLAKQVSLPNSNRKHYGCGGVPWAYSGVVSAPSTCPICYEDLDFTDTSFLPCLCGFRLCLFCHKRILEEDSRCPGCRKPYEHEPVEAEASVHGGSLTFRLPRSCSLITRERKYPDISETYVIL
ncbi:RING/U-box superfamily protein [Prunus dulcis]|uniref:RING/U-box superfamily protein n=1 Tax=Prunus dulcis TaxID=3755 RepID=A0A4Y1RIY8_PRUDU|nr:RING/U-box superfamily protein [Prunus dulcis]